MLFEKSFDDKYSLNVFFTLFIGLFAIFIYDKCKYKFLGIIAAIALGVLAQYINTDYGAYGIAIIFIFYIFKNNYINTTIFFMIATATKYASPLYKTNMHPTVLKLYIGTCIPIILINLYNGKKGKDMKYFFYLFYPIHLLLLFGLNSIL